MYMAAGQATAIAGKLIAGGLSGDMPVVIVENASLSDAKQTATTLKRLQNATERMTHGGPALLMIGRVFERVADAQLPALAAEAERVAAIAARRA
jgi:siroheme synthase